MLMQEIGTFWMFLVKKNVIYGVSDKAEILRCKSESQRVRIKKNKLFGSRYGFCLALIALLLNLPWNSAS